MPERDFIVEKKRIAYEGLFSVSELYRLIDEYFENLGYDRVELKNTEVVQPDGKYIEIEFEPYKSVTDWAKETIHIRMIFSQVKEVDVKRDDIPKRLNSGKVQLIIDAWLASDTNKMWEEKPIYYLLRQVFHKYVYPPVTNKFKADMKNHVNRLCDEVKAFLNLYRF